MICDEIDEGMFYDTDVQRHRRERARDITNELQMSEDGCEDLKADHALSCSLLRSFVRVYIDVCIIVQ